MEQADGRNEDSAWDQKQKLSLPKLSGYYHWQTSQLPSGEANVESSVWYHISKSTIFGGKLITSDLFNLEWGSNSS